MVIGRSSPSNTGNGSAYNNSKRGSSGGGANTSSSHGTAANTVMTSGFGGGIDSALGNSKGFQVPNLYFKSKKSYSIIIYQ